MHSKTFRLFVSSTFSDFTQERKLLQTIVFPKIKNYCTKHNLVFQPIDLRWGVTDEASNNQKTLELCLEEVKTSKINPHPNFLIMMGDRYGTVILPYAIEQEEFETIQNKVTDTKDLELLNTWYELDENQIPASYTLQERKNSDNSHDGQDYTDRKNWKPINEKLLEILQIAVKNSNLNNEQKKKYFASATEAEIIEGIFKYLHKTDFQNKYLEEITNKDVEKIDSENVYAYIRNIKSLDNDGLKENLIDIDLTNVELIKGNKNKKGELQKALDKDNIFSVDADLTNVARDEYDKLTYFYKELNDTKESFVSEMTKYLKRSIDKHIELIKKTNYTQEQLDKFEQERFKSDKLKDFLEGSRTNALKAIDEYLKNDNNQALVVYGKSGLGKSSLIAKAIDETIKEKGKDKVVYRFVGATSNTTTSPQLLISILKEFGIEEEIRTVKDEATGQEKLEPLEEFYDRINEHFRSITQEKVIYIDAVDQLTTEDEFIWLPLQLPSNLKIIISALEDKKYEEDSKYLEKIKTKTSNLYELELFTSAKELVDKILKRYDRKITDDQMKYLLNIYRDINTPLYLSVAAQEMRHWKSEDKTIDKDPKGQKLASTQQDIIKEYIENLTKFYHHDEELVKKVFSYLYLSDGLSESELLEILNTDKEFIEKIASDKHHKKENPELPIVIWARIYTQIKEFLKLEEKDGQETMKFFHREFNQVISGEDETEELKKLKKEEIKKIHEQLIELLQKLIVKHQNEEFDSNRWGILYVEIVKNYHLKYEFEYLRNPNSKLYKWIFTVSALNNNYTKDLMIYCNDSLVDSQSSNKTKDMNTFAKMFYFISKQDKEKWEEYYLKSLIALSSSLKSVELVNDAIKLEKESLEILEKLYIQNNEKWLVSYTINLNVLGNSYYIKNDFKEAIKYFEGYLGIVKEQYLIDKKTWSDEYTLGLINIASCFKSNRQIDEAIKLEKKSLEILEKLCINDKHEPNKIYISNLNNLASSFYEKYHDIPLENKYFYEAVNYSKKAKEILEKAYEKDKNKWVESYTNNLNNLASIYKEYDRYQKSEEYFQEIINLENKCYEIRKSYYEENNDRWADDYIIILNNLADFWRHRDLNKSIEYAKEALGILEKLYEQDKERWAENYIRSLNNFASSLKSTGEIEESIKYSKELFTILEKLYNQDKEKWTENYTKSLNNFALTLNNFASSLKLTGEIKESIKYFKDELEILEKLYKQDNERWAEDYQISLYNLALNLESIGKIEESITLKKEALDIIRFLYNKNPSLWIDDYIVIIGNLAEYYLKNKLFKESSKFFEIYYNIFEFNKINDISPFVYLFIKWYQCEKSLKNLEKLKKLEEKSLKLINFYKIKLSNSYDKEIEIKFNAYKNLANSSNNDFDKEKFEIFKILFYSDKI